MSTGAPEQQQGLGCFTLTGIFLFICWSIETVVLLTHSPMDFVSLSVYTTLFVLCLFLFSPWGRSLVWRRPIIAKSPLLLFVFFGLYLLLKEYPLNSAQMILGILTLGIFLFSLSPWFKYVLRWFPLLLIVLILLLGILTTYPVVIKQPVDYFKMFSTLFIVISMISFLLLFLRFLQRRRLNKTKDINFSLGQARLLEEEIASSEKPVVDAHFLGVSLQIFRSGKFTRITISTD